MAESVKRVRNYNSARRQEHRFLADGYASTSVPAIAAGAGVSVETVYKVFGNKAGVLKALFDVAIVGDEEPVPLVERDVVKRNMAEPDPRKKLRMYAEFFAESATRAHPYQLLARNAATSDPAAAAVRDQMVKERLVGMGHFARHLGDGGYLRADVTVDDARDVLWTFISVELWELLVIQRGWSPPKFAVWMGDMLVAALLPRENA
jgi:AcrR family transcriptional regulator